jgi:hypothetical protein
MSEEEKKRIVKNFKTWIVLNYKTGQFRVIKKIRGIKPSEVAIEMNLDVALPEPAKMVAHGSIELSSAKMAKMTLEELEE